MSLEEDLQAIKDKYFEVNKSMEEELSEIEDFIKEELSDLANKKIEDLDEYTFQDIIININDWHEKNEAISSSLEENEEALLAFAEEHCTKMYTRENQEIGRKQYANLFDSNVLLKAKYETILKEMEDLQNKYQKLVDYVNTLDGAIRIDNALKEEAKKAESFSKTMSIKGGFITD